MRIKLQEIKSNPYDTRKDYGDLSGLKSSIKKFGLLQPLIVRKAEDGKYEIAFGSRRLEAMKELGYKEVEVDIRKIDDPDMATMGICENLHRKDMTPVEMAWAYKRGLDATKLTVQQFAEVVGVKDLTIRNYLAILNLPKRMLDNCEKYKISDLISIGILTEKSKTLGIMLENRLENESIPTQISAEIRRGCVRVMESQLPHKRKMDVCQKIIFEDYSRLKPDQYHQVMNFAEHLLEEALLKYDKRVAQTKDSLLKAKAALIKIGIPTTKKIRHIGDIIDPDQKLGEVIETLKDSHKKISLSIDKGYYNHASLKVRKKFDFWVNKVVSGLESLLIRK